MGGPIGEDPPRITPAKIMSDVAIKAKVVDAAHLLVTLYFSHDYVCVLLVGPLLAQQLVQVDCLQCAHLRRLLY